MQIIRVCWSDRKPFIEALYELWQKSVARSDITDSSQSQFFYKPILQCAMIDWQEPFGLVMVLLYGCVVGKASMVHLSMAGVLGEVPDGFGTSARRL